MAGDTGVYVIQHLASGRRYVGSAVSFKKRWREHINAIERGVHHSSYLQRCWRKHGPDAFSFTVALYCDRENLLMYEQALIDFYQPEFNSNPTAGSMLGFRMSAESKAKLSVAAKRTKNFTGHRHSDESKQRISEKKSGVKFGAYPRDRVERTAAAMRAGKNAMTETEVRLVRSLHRLGMCHREVAQWVGRSYWAVADIARNRTFCWVK
jgi:group I intron endonuclease